MSEPKWTPGPWRIVVDGWNAKLNKPWTGAINIEGDVNSPLSVPPLVCALYRGARNDANARLISAAPDLYEALMGVVRVADRNTVEFDAARAALAKARGETP